MNKINKYFTFFLLFIFIYLLFRYNFLLQKSVSDAFNLWLNKVFPSLFLIFILSDIIINCDILNGLNFFNKIFNKIFKTSNKSGEAFLLSIIGGTPTSTYIINNMLNNNLLSIDDANKLISFTYFSNPLFLYNILILSFNKFITFKIIIIHYLTNIIIGLIFSNKYNNVEVKSTLNQNKKNIFKILPMAIKNSINNLLIILGTITFYMVITNLIIKIIPLNNTIAIIIKGFLEITQSLNVLTSLNSISMIKEIIAIAIISFGGLSIHTQVASLINDSNIKYINFLYGRILHLIISTSIYIFISIA